MRNIENKNKLFNRKTDRFLSHHPMAAYVMLSVAMPIAMMLGVAAIAIVCSFPIVFINGLR